MKKKADIGLIGLAVMGENLVLNMESKGFTVAVFNRTVEKLIGSLPEGGTGKASSAHTPLMSLCSPWRNHAN